MGLSVEIYKGDCVIAWFLLPKGHTNHTPWEMGFSQESFVDNSYAARCSAIFFRWYLCRLKPQDISPSSSITPSVPLRRSRLYPLFHLIPPKVPSAWMLRFILRRAPCTLFRLSRTSLWNFVSSSLIRTMRFSLLLWHFSLCGQSVQSSHW